MLCLLKSRHADLCKGLCSGECASVYGDEAGHDDSDRVPHGVSEFDVSLPVPDVRGWDTAGVCMSAAQHCGCCVPTAAVCVGVVLPCCVFSTRGGVRSRQLAVVRDARWCVLVCVACRVGTALGRHVESSAHCMQWGPVHIRTCA